ncbi:MAG: SH3 domain-containing protein [Clostridia bacterium]|nr:SH3 domain-containing protein [Clostridia bacterium]
MITASQFLEGVRRNVARVDRYELGQDGRNGACDCIGLIIGALRLMGETWTGTHGSNYAARNEMNILMAMRADALKTGDVVYKAHEPGEDGYALPEKYNNSGDVRDYYHIGVVTRTNPLEITHCTGVKGGIKKDTKVGNWNYFGKLRKVNYEEERVEPMQTMYVQTENKGALNMRNGPGTNYQTIVRIPYGAEVMSTVYDNEWSKVVYKENTGYVMSRYLQKENPAADEEAGEKVTLSLDRETAKKLFEALGAVL